MNPDYDFTALKLQLVLDLGSVSSETVLPVLHHALGNGTHIVLSSAVFHVACQMHFSVFLWYS